MEPIVVSPSSSSSSPHLQRVESMLGVIAPEWGKSALTRNRLLGEVVHILHSSRQNPLIVHRELICAASPFFKAAFEGDQNNQDGIVTLHQDQYDRDAVETYLKWLYTNQILSPSGDDEYRYLIDAYLTGDKFGDTAFKNAVLDEIIERCSQQNEYPTDIAEYIWSNTAEGSPLRRLYVDFYAWVSDSDFYAMDDGGSDILVAPREFLRDVLCRMSEVRNRCRFPGAYIYPWVMNRCQYHEHGGGDCYRSSDWGSPSTLTNLYWTLNDEK